MEKKNDSKTIEVFEYNKEKRGEVFERRINKAERLVESFKNELDRYWAKVESGPFSKKEKEQIIVKIEYLKKQADFRLQNLKDELMEIEQGVFWAKDQKERKGLLKQASSRYEQFKADYDKRQAKETARKLSQKDDEVSGLVEEGSLAKNKKDVVVIEKFKKDKQPEQEQDFDNFDILDSETKGFSEQVMSTEAEDKKSFEKEEKSAETGRTTEDSSNILSYYEDKEAERFKRQARQIKQEKEIKSYDSDKSREHKDYNEFREIYPNISSKKEAPVEGNNEKTNKAPGQILDSKNEIKEFGDQEFAKQKEAKEESKEEKIKRALESGEKIDKGVLKKAEQFGLKERDLAKIEGFSELSQGQQFLALKNLKQIILGRIQEEAAKQYKEDVAKANFLGRIWKGMSKAYQIAKLENVKAKEIVKGGLKIHQGSLQQLVNGLKEFGPEVKIREGELEIQYVSGLEGLNSEEKIKVEKFNKAATEFSKVPYEWSLPSAEKKDKKKYNKFLKQYEQARDQLLKIVVEKKGEMEGNLYLNKIEYQVKMNQFLNSNPELEEGEILKVREEKAWRSALKSTFTERGVYMLGGSVVRAVTVSTLGAIGAPAGAAIVGGGIAGLRARKGLVESDKAIRRGDEKGSIKIRKYSKIEKVSDKINLLIKRMQDENLSAEKRRAYEKSLKLNIKWIEDKIDKGLINFGEHDQRIVRQYKLFQFLGLAKGQIKEYQLAQKFQKRFERAIEARDSLEKRKRRKYIAKKIAIGAGIAAGFAYAGEKIVDYFGWHLGGGKGKGGHIDKGLVNHSQSTSKGVAGQAAENLKPKGPGAQTTEHAQSAQGIGHEVKQAGGQPKAGSPEAAQQTIKKPKLGDHHQVATKHKAPERLGNIEPASQEKLTKALQGVSIKIKDSDVGSGDSIYTISKKFVNKFFEHIDKHSNIKFSPELNEALRTHNADHLKDVIMQNPEKYGLPKHFNPTNLSVQKLQKIKWDQAIKDAFGKDYKKMTLKLSPEKVNSILEQKQHLKEYFVKHPNTPRTPEGYRAAEDAFKANKTGTVDAPSGPKTAGNMFKGHRALINEGESYWDFRRSLKDDPLRDGWTLQRTGPKQYDVFNSQGMKVGEFKSGEGFYPATGAEQGFYQAGSEYLQQEAARHSASGSAAAAHKASQEAMEQAVAKKAAQVEQAKNLAQQPKQPAPDHKASAEALTNKKAAGQTAEDLRPGPEEIDIRKFSIDELANKLKMPRRKIRALRDIMDIGYYTPKEKVEYLLELINKNRLTAQDAAKYYAFHIKPDSLKNITDVEAYKTFRDVLNSILKEGNRKQAKLLADLLSSLSE